MVYTFVSLPHSVYATISYTFTLNRVVLRILLLESRTVWWTVRTFIAHNSYYLLYPAHRVAFHRNSTNSLLCGNKTKTQNRRERYQTVFCTVQFGLLCRNVPDRRHLNYTWGFTMRDSGCVWCDRVSSGEWLRHFEGSLCLHLLSVTSQHTWHHINSAVKISFLATDIYETSCV
jgi:hypothetical protein